MQVLEEEETSWICSEAWRDVPEASWVLRDGGVVDIWNVRVGEERRVWVRRREERLRRRRVKELNMD